MKQPGVSPRAVLLRPPFGGDKAKRDGIFDRPREFVPELRPAPVSKGRDAAGAKIRDSLSKRPAKGHLLGGPAPGLISFAFPRGVTMSSAICFPNPSTASATARQTDVRGTPPQEGTTDAATPGNVRPSAPAGRVFGLIFLFGTAVFLGVSLGRADREYWALVRLATCGRVTEGYVVACAPARSPFATSFRLEYAFKVGGRTYTGTARVSDVEDVLAGETFGVSVTYLGGDPSVNTAGVRERIWVEHSRAGLLAWVGALFLAEVLVCWFLVLGIRNLLRTRKGADPSPEGAA
jgi:hypothetical protein